MTTGENTVAVIVPAYNAEGTVADAIRSALAEPEVGEVVVVDDASKDATAGRARAADDGTGRLKVLRAEVNAGPSAARNRAIAESTAPILAILDADDRILPGRFANLLGVPDWDILADNILFVTPETEAATLTAFRPGAGAGTVTDLDFATFVLGNVTRRGMRRRELGFLHPLIRRDFLARHALLYADDIRLGEDYDLYTRALLAGARFRLATSLGYFAVEHAGSLSGSHRTHDLSRLCAVDDALLADPRLTPDQRRAVLTHRRSLAARFHLRHFLDDKRERGLLPAGLRLLTRPTTFGDVASGVFHDKLDDAKRRITPRRRDSRPQTLFDAPQWEGR
ncbi:glycosyltransferase family 2 protein [Acuticoccus kandeliae]|uniref:glycosyltransferase family 2 protein n=1 Tax=Acuticoccus kandeliae TaxID=2073160 RepID=UPI000D3E7B9D|nr:glycosyltransferase [Acuticoccus kandeliae]